METRTHRVELRVDVGGLVSPQDQNPGRHVARVLAGHQDGELPERRHRLSGVSVTRVVGGDSEELGPRLPDDDASVHEDVDEVRAGAAVGLPVGFRVLVGQLVRSMVIGRHLHLLPAFVLLQLHAGPWTQHRQLEAHLPQCANSPSHCRSKVEKHHRRAA